MNYTSLGKSGIEVSNIGLGTWAIGGGPWWGDNDDVVSIRAIHAALDQGVNLIDTAAVYGFGHSETVVGKAIVGRRDQVVLATKGGLWWDDDRGSLHFEQNGRCVNRCLRPETLIIEIERSLKRLQTDYIDLYQTHWQVGPEDPTPIEETMGCLMKLQEQGKIRAIGASNTNPEQITQYLRFGKLVSVQERYSMLDRKLEDEIIPLCRKEDVAILAYSPLEQGLLSGKVSMDTVFDSTSFRNRLPWFQLEKRGEVLEILQKWRALTDKYDCTLSQLVIAWTIAQPGITSALCGARTPEHALENSRGGMLQLENDDLMLMRTHVESLLTE